MGGFGSGRWQLGKDTTSNYRQLDIRKLQREGFLKPRRKFSWGWERNDGNKATINVHVEVDKIILSYKHRSNGGEWKDESYSVWLDWTSCNYGENRVWFLCPEKGCGKRVAILYGGAIFACRHCHKLAYSCQRENAGDRALRRINSIRRRLGWESCILDFPGDKPKGMHWRTYEQLTHQHNVHLSTSLDGMKAQLGLKDKV